MWSPTHVQVLVLRAKGLNVKGKHGTNDAFVTIALGKEKFQTSVKEKSSDPVEWNEPCELNIPSQGNTAEVSLTVLHRNFLGVDEFLGQICLPLRDFDVYERPKTKWHTLKCKPGKVKTDYRGEIEVKMGFTVKANNTGGGSVADLTKKNKGSISSLKKVGGNIGGSLMSLGSKENKNMKKFAKSVSQKVEKARQSVSTLQLNKEKGGLEPLSETVERDSVDKTRIEREQEDENLDPGVNSDDEPRIQTMSNLGSKNTLSRNQFEHGSSIQSSCIERSGRQECIPKSIVSPPTHQIPNATPTATQEAPRNVSNTSSRREPHAANESDTKLLAKKVPETQTGILQSHHLQSKHKTNHPTELQSGLPSYDEAIEESNKNERKLIKKKIIPVHSDVECSPSPENPPSPIESPAVYKNNRFCKSRSTMNLAQKGDGKLEGKKKSLGLKLKSSYSSLLDLSKYGKANGFRDRGDLVSDELNNSFNSRTYSDGSNGPPHGTRIVLGREKSPTSHLPHDVLAQYNGKTREDLIEMVATLQNTVNLQGRKMNDLEDYIENLLIKVLEVAPVLLKKDSHLVSKHHNG